MTPPVKLPPQVQEASAEYKSRRDQVLAIKDTTWYKFIVEWFTRERERTMKELLTCSLETDTDKKNLFTVRGEYNIADGFLTYLNNLELSKEKEK
mgnify:FL=1